MSRRVFISHSSHDADAATALVSALEAHGIACWIAPRDVAPGLRYGEALIDGINACFLLILLLSERSNASPQVLAEVERAVSKGLPVLTIRLEPVTLTKSLEYFLSSFHWIDAFPLPLTPHLTRLVEAVRQSVGTPTPQTEAQTVPPPAPRRETPNNLPHQLTSFIGRGEEIARITGHLRAARLVTLTGSGGTGKTRLSLQIASTALSTFEDGVWFVELAPLSDPALVTPTVADALSVREEPGTALIKTVCASLAAKRLLLILDNCEHVLAACTALSMELLRACPGVTILASSREPLGVPGEVVYRVPPLSLPDAGPATTAAGINDCEAVRLFETRAQAARSDFAVTDANAPAVAQVCRRLDGIPLALELAAARVKMLSVDDVNTRLDNRFRLLTGGSKALLPRQQTLRALIDWSYDLLTEQEKAVLMRLSVFAGGWDLAAAETVCAGEGVEEWEVLDLLTALVDKSLVVPAEAGGVGRYRLLETVRQYAAERLEASGRDAAARERHRDVFAALAAEAEPHLRGPEQGAWLSRLDAEQDNLREALAWCETEAKQETASERVAVWLGLCAALGQFWQTRGDYSAGRQLLERALMGTAGVGQLGERGRALLWAGTLASQQGDYAAARALAASALTAARSLGDKTTTARALNILGYIALNQGDYGAGRALAEEALGIFRQIGDPRGIANTLNTLGGIAHDQGDYGAGRALLEEALSVYRQIGDQHGVAYALNNLGDIAQNQGDYGAGRALQMEALGIFRGIGAQRGVANALNNLGSNAQSQGDYGAGRALLEEALSVYRQIGAQHPVAYVLSSLGNIAQHQGDYGAGRALLEEALSVYRQIGAQDGVAYVLNGLAAATASAGNAVRAGRLWGATNALCKAVGLSLEPTDRARMAAGQAQARVLVGDAAFEAALADGALLTLDEAVAEALAPG